jgi:hypothetical protein
MVTDVTSLAMIKNTALLHGPVGKFFSWIVHHLTFSIMFVPFWTMSFQIIGSEEEDPFPGPIILQIYILYNIKDLRFSH